VEAFLIPDQTAETSARIYATQVVTRHGTGSQLITDQDRSFMSSFFQETCKTLGIRTTRTTSSTPNQMASLKGGIDRCTPRFLLTLTQQIIGTRWYPFILHVCPIGLHRTALQDIAPSSFYTGEKWRSPTTIT